MINIAKFPLKTIVPVCISSSNVHEWPKGCIVKLCQFYQMTGETCYLRVILICFSLIRTDTEHVFICLKAICIPYR